MNNSEEAYLLRVRFLLSVMLFGFVGLFCAQAYKQIFKNAYYLNLAKSQHFLAKELPAHRGEIYASSIYSKEPFLLAGNEKLFSLNLVPRQILDKEKTARKIAELANLKYEEVYEAINNNKPYIPPIKKDLTFKEAQNILKEELSGVYILPHDHRFYPYGSLLSAVLGYVDTEGKGNYGLEQYYDKELRGDSGFFMAEKDVYGRYININQETPPKNGTNLFLTIELPIQFKAEEIIKQAVKDYAAEDGQIIVLNPKTGAIIAMAQSKTFNPENYSKEAESRGISVFYNDVVSSLYEPGSIFKVVPALVALEKKVVEPSTLFDVEASIEVGGQRIWTALRQAEGRITFSRILEHSNNVGIIKVQQMVGKEAFYEFLVNRFRFNLPLGIDLPNEMNAQFPSLSDFKDIEAATMSFGQGIAITPLQAASIFAAIANDGVLMKPYIVGKKIDSQGNVETVEPKEIGRIVDKETARKMRDILYSVVEEGYSGLAKVPGYKVGGKTGTAQVPSPQGGYDPNKTIHSFAGIFPLDDPQFVILVKLDYPKAVQWAASSAAPVFSKIASFIANYYQIPKK